MEDNSVVKPESPLGKVAKVFGWNWLGEQLGVPVVEMVGNLDQAIQRERDQIIREKQDLQEKLSRSSLSYQDLQEKLSRSSLSYLQIWIDNYKLQKENEQLRRRMQELETQTAAQLQPLPETRKEARSELSTSRWLEVMPDFARCLILGAPGSGKSATGHMLLELFRWKKKPYILGFPKEKEHVLSPWIGLAESFDKIPSGSIILVDEAYLLYHARKSGFDKSVQEMSEALGLARQRGHSILFVAHEARHLDKNIVGYVNVVVVKEPGVLDLKFERPELRDVLDKAREFFQGIGAEARKQWSYVWSPEANFEGPLRSSLPSYWSKELSSAYAGGISSPAERPAGVSKEEKKRQAKALRKAGRSYGEIAQELGVSKPTIINWVKHNR